MGLFLFNFRACADMQLLVVPRNDPQGPIRFFQLNWVEYLVSEYSGLLPHTKLPQGMSVRMNGCPEHLPIQSGSIQYIDGGADGKGR